MNGWCTPVVLGIVLIIVVVVIRSPNKNRGLDGYFELNCKKTQKTYKKNNQIENVQPNHIP